MTGTCSRIAMKCIPLSVLNRGAGQKIRLILLVMAVAVFNTVCAPFPITGALPVEAAQFQGTVDFQRLTGKWVRTDGGYVLELRDFKNDGSVKAAYFNPRPINVSSAEVHKIKDKINIFVELRDINYPGSKYNLRYDPKTDRLLGTYFQAVDRQLFEVEFVRTK